MMQQPPDNAESNSYSASIIPGHAPINEKVQFILGPYQILSSIGKGGMGEVFHAYDTRCGRRVALKRIRSDLIEHPQLYKRFLKEARITSQLIHPAIIPIYEIYQDAQSLYYTMPFVSGETLKAMLRRARQLEKLGKKGEAEGSIPALVRVFLTVCQAVAYAHSKGVLHRDLKPENIIVGQYGQIVILDWGLAKPIRSTQDDELFPETAIFREMDITRIGKVVGTVTYMAPERGLGHPATIQTDIYALGVMLYQILTLHHPFKRGSLKEFRESVHNEQFRDPNEVAPYRDVPPMLSRIAKKCLAVSLEERYKTVDALIRDLENYIEGRSEWFPVAKLNIANKEDWEFQEHVLIAEHMAILRHTEVVDWVNLMVSKASFPENTKIETTIKLGEKCQGIGFIVSIPESSERKHLNDGYCLWIGSDRFKGTKLLRSTLEVVTAPDVFLHRDTRYLIRLEKVENNIYFYLNDVLQFSYITHIPLIGTHVGVISRDVDFEISDLIISSGGQSVTVNCLAVPDAFLDKGDFTHALSEYRRIGYSFPGRVEGREAMFRAGITLLEQAKGSTNEKDAHQYFELALTEFEKLQSTPGAPLQYLGKALVYRELNEFQEEIKCFEIAFRRYPHHPLLPLLQEHILARMNEASHTDRRATYRLILFAVQHFKSIPDNAKKLFINLKKHWEPLPFIIGDNQEELTDNFGIALGFWLAKSYILEEMIDTLCGKEKVDGTAVCNALYCLIELGSIESAEKKLRQIRSAEYLHSKDLIQELDGLDLVIHAQRNDLQAAIHSFLISHKVSFNSSDTRILFALIELALIQEKKLLIHQIADQVSEKLLSEEDKGRFKAYRIQNALYEKDWTTAGDLLNTFSLDKLTKENSILYFLYGCWLYVTEGREIAEIHFSSVLDAAYPPSWSLGSLFLFNWNKEKQEQWLQQAFAWEKRHLYSQLRLFYHCIDEPALSKYYSQLENETF